MTFCISKQKAIADLNRKSKIIVWDEAPMNHHYLLEALERAL